MKSLNKLWPRAGAIIAIIIISCMLIFRWDELTETEILGWLNLAFLMLHQFEEYVLPGGFKYFFNQCIYRKSGFIRNRLNDTAIFHINVSIAWTAYFVAAMSGEEVFLMALLFINFINGLLHTVMAVTRRKYNPGLITALLMLIPFTLYVAFHFSRQGVLSATDWLTAVIAAFAGSMSIPLVLYLSREKEGFRNYK